jgi:hypothetical protein
MVVIIYSTILRLIIQVLTDADDDRFSKFIDKMLPATISYL